MFLPESFVECNLIFLYMVYSKLSFTKKQYYINLYKKGDKHLPVSLSFAAFYFMPFS